MGMDTGHRSTGHMVARQASDTEALARPLFVRLAVWRGWLKGKSEGLLHARRESTTVRTCSLFWSRSRQACCSAVVHGWQRHWRCRLRVAFPARSRPDITAQEGSLSSTLQCYARNSNHAGLAPVATAPSSASRSTVPSCLPNHRHVSVEPKSSAPASMAPS